MRVLFSSTVKQILDGSVEMSVNDEVETIANDSVVVSAGGILSSAFLKTVGIHVETKFGSE